MQYDGPSGQCRGTPRCFEGWTRAGQACIQHPLECDAGYEVSERTDGQCCWPGQSWDHDAGDCAGAPTSCPEGTLATDRECSVEAFERADAARRAREAEQEAARRDAAEQWRLAEEHRLRLEQEDALRAASEAAERGERLRQARRERRDFDLSIDFGMSHGRLPSLVGLSTKGLSFGLGLTARGYLWLPREYSSPKRGLMFSGEFRQSRIASGTSDGAEPAAARLNMFRLGAHFLPMGEFGVGIGVLMDVRAWSLPTFDTSLQTMAGLSLSFGNHYDMVRFVMEGHWFPLGSGSLGTLGALFDVAYGETFMFGLKVGFDRQMSDGELFDDGGFIMNFGVQLGYHW